MRGFKNFKGSDASGPSMYSYSMVRPVIRLTNTVVRFQIYEQLVWTRPVFFWLPVAALENPLVPKWLTAIIIILAPDSESRICSQHLHSQQFVWVDKGCGQEIKGVLSWEIEVGGGGVMVS